MSLNDTSADVAQAIAQSKQLADQEWLSDYIIGFLKSPSWVTPVMEYIEQHCIIFDSEAENKLEYTAKHKEFKALIDGLLAAHLLEVSIGEEEFQQFIQAGLANKSLHHILVEQLLAVDDFLTFKAMMVQKNKQLQMQAFQQLEMHQQQQEKEAIQEFATEVAESLVSMQPQPEAQDQDETLGEVEDVQDCTVLSEGNLSPSGRGSQGDWSLYEEEDHQLMKVLRISEEAVISHAAEMSDIRKQQEEAEIKLAMALSMQVEENRQQGEYVKSQEDRAESTDSGGASSSIDNTQADDHATKPEVHVIPEVPSQEIPAEVPAPTTAEVEQTAASLEEKPFSIAEMDALDNSRPRQEMKAPLVMPRMVTLAPVIPPAKAVVKKTTVASLYEGDGTSGPIPVKANVMDMKAATKASAPAPAPAKIPLSAAVCVPTPQRPTAEEVRQRAEHLKHQRELLLQKKKQEREQKLQKFQKAVDRKVQVQSPNAPKRDSQELLSQLTAQPEPDAASQVSLKEAERAARMRQALTARLKESLYQSLSAA